MADELLSLWRSPLDKLALVQAADRAAVQPRCDSTIDQLPTATPGLNDVVPVWHAASNQTIQVTLQQLQKLIGGGGGTPSITFPTDFSALTIYNYGTYVGSTNLSPPTNVAALENMFADMAAGTLPAMSGGLAWIPQYEFAVQGVGLGIQVPDQTIIQGLGGGGNSTSGVPAFHFIISDSGGAASTLFQTGGAHSTGGVEFRNLSFSWPGAAYAGGGGAFGDTVIYAGVLATRVLRCTFFNCPTAVNFAGIVTTGNDLSGIAEQCTVFYNTGPPNATAFIMAGEQCQIVGPSELAQMGPSSGGPLGCTCIAVGGKTAGSEHQVIERCHISDWTIGIDFADTNNTGIGTGAQYTHIWNNEMQCVGTCINIQAQGPPPAGGQIYGAKIIGNTMIKGQGATDGRPIVLIDTNGGPNSNVSTIDLIGNYIFGNVTTGHGGTAVAGQYGIQINAGDSIRIIGGRIGNVGTKTPPDGTANIGITGNCQSVIINGVDLRPSVSNGPPTGATSSSNSQWAFLVTSAVTGFPFPVQVRNCNMSNYPAPGPVHVGANLPTGGLFISGCPGYNDQNTPLCIALGSSAPVANASGAWQVTTQLPAPAAAVNYYGPSQITFISAAGASTFSLNGFVSNLPAGTFQVVYLASPYDRIQFSVQPQTFAWIGK